MATIPGQIFDFTVEDSSFMGLIRKINSFTDIGQGGVLGIFILLVSGGSLLLMMRNYGNERAFPVTSIFTAIIATLLRTMELINDVVLGICIALGVISLIYLIKEQGKYE